MRLLSAVKRATGARLRENLHANCYRNLCNPYQRFENMDLVSLRRKEGRMQLFATLRLLGRPGRDGCQVHCETVFEDAISTWRQISPPKQSHNAL